MIKFLFVFFNIIANNFFYDPSGVELLFTPNEEINEDLYEINGEFKVYKNENNYIINSKSFEIKTAVYSDIIKFENEIYLSYWEKDKIYINVFDEKGNLVRRINNLNFNALEKHKMIIYNNKLLLITTSFNEKEIARDDLLLHNIMIYDVIANRYNVFGGILNEEFIDVRVKEELYICLSKGSLTYGDFGNGGNKKENFTIAKFDNDLKVVDYNVLNIDFDNNTNLKVINNIYIVTKNKIYMCDLNIELLFSFEYIGRVFVGMNYIVVFDGNIISLYDLKTLKHYYTVEYDLSGASIIIMNDQILMHDSIYYSFDIIDFQHFEVINSPYFEGCNEKLLSLYGDLEVISKEYLDYYDKGIFGTYEYEINYKNKNNVSFIVSGVEEILLEVNVVDNMVYPIGYRLLFNGTGVLDGKTIVNNYPLNTVGKHVLTVYGNNIQKEIMFEVCDSLLEYNDIVYNNYDICVNKNENFKMELSFSGFIDEAEVSNVICNWEILECEYKEQKLNVVFKGKEETGKYILYIERALCLYDGLEYEIEINKFYEIIVCFKNGDINVGKMSDEFELEIEYFGNVENLRGFEIVFENGNDTYSKKIILDGNSKTVEMVNVPDGVYQVTLYLITYNLTGYIYDEMINMNLNFKEENIKILDVDNYMEEGFQKIKVCFDEKQISNIKDIYYNGNKIYEGENTNVVLIIVVIAIFSLIGLFIGQFVNKKYFNKTK